LTKCYSVQTTSSYYYQYRYGEGPCPHCGRDTILRQGPHGLFYGCTAFPKCSGTRHYNGEGRSLFDSMGETTTDDPYAELVGNLIATGGSHNTKGGSMSDSRKSPVKLTMKQIVEAHSVPLREPGYVPGNDSTCRRQRSHRNRSGFRSPSAPFSRCRNSSDSRSASRGAADKKTAKQRLAEIEQYLDEIEQRMVEIEQRLEQAGKPRVPERRRRVGAALMWINSKWVPVVLFSIAFFCFCAIYDTRCGSRGHA
jgi:ssDNA-binding Zn-finger/Zn-ribbon topoisomerase 1